ncbi:uncharacterized protein [Haliotis cracherodii]|uniref:uncharacterized protein n=1 Tax=Haliotis cracherodii TaxID=6455 RepID=UPI0039E9C19F
MDLTTTSSDPITEDSFRPGLYDVIPRSVFITFGVILVVAGFTGNIFLILICCLDAELRRSSKHFIITSLSLLCLLEQCLSAFIVHTHIYNIENIAGTYGCAVSYFISASSYISVSVTVLLVAAVAFDSALTLCLNPPVKATLRVCISLECVVFIVIGSTFMLLPLMNVSAYSDACNVHMKEHYMLALNLIHFIPQCLILFLANLILFMCYSRKVRSCPDATLPHPTDVYLASALVVLLKLPDFIFSLGFKTCNDDDGNGMSIFWMVATYTSTSIYVALPYLWLSGQDTRQGAKRVLLGRCLRKTCTQDMYILTSSEEFKGSYR